MYCTKEKDNMTRRQQPDNDTNALLAEPLLPTSSTERIEETNRQEEEQEHATNRNITFTLIYTCFAFAGRSIWQQSVLATYVFLIMKENPEAVGFITAVMGFAQLCASVPTGYLADKYRRDTMLKLASAVGLLAISVTLIALFVFQSYYVLVLALGVWGLVWGIANTALGALFADSIRDGDRPYFFTKRSILINLGNTVGPSIALAMFFVLGDHWTVRDCAIVMTLGQTICLPAIILLGFFNDDYAVPRRANNMQSSENDTNTDNTNSNSTTAPLLEMSEPEESSRLSSSSSNNLQSCENRNSLRADSISMHEYVYYCIPKQRLAPILISIGDLTSGLASGMSIRYFPIFFVDRLNLSPVEVQVLYILAPLMQASLMKLGQYTSQTFGRCCIAITHKWIGIICMIMLVLSAHYGLPAWLICTMFVIRTGFMNSTSPLTKSILMDNVPAKERGRWSALESVNMFSWSGSAAFGGFLVSFDGLLFNFSVTAALQFLATLPVLVLMNSMDLEGTNVSNDETSGDDPGSPHTNNVAASSGGETTTDDESSVDTSNPQIVQV